LLWGIQPAAVSLHRKPEELLPGEKQC